MPEAESSSVGFHLLTLGAPRLEITDRATGSTRIVGPGKSLALITYLAFAPRHTAARDALCELLWGDRHVEQSRPLLRQTLWLVKTQISSDILIASGDSVSLGRPVSSDTEEFMTAIEADDLVRAISLYTGEFFSGYAAPGAGRFEEWVNLERTRFRGLFMHAAELLARRALDSGRFADAITLAARMRIADTNAQSGWRLLLEARVASGDVIGARAEADQFEQWLKAEEWEPEPGSLAAIQAARRNAAVYDSSDGGIGLVAELVGREQEFSAITHAWSAAQVKGARIVQITGEGGVGKTRLARDVLSRIRSSRGRGKYIRANYGERCIPFSFAAAIAEGLSSLPGSGGIAPAAANALVALCPALSSRYIGAAGAGEALTPLRVGLALLEVLTAIAEENPVAIVLDDLHWSDPSSHEVLTVVGSRLTSEKVLLIATLRPHHGIKLVGAKVTEIRLAPLSETNVAALVTSLARLPETDWARDLPHALHASTAGVPLRVLDALRFCIDSGTLARVGEQWSSPDPAALHASLEKTATIERRISSLPRDATAALLLIGVAGMSVPRPIILAALGVPQSHATTTISDLEVRGLVVDEEGSVVLAHDTISDVILSRASAGEILSARRALAMAFASSSDFRWRRKSVAIFAAAGRWRDAANHAIPHLRGFTSSPAELDIHLDSLLGAAASEENRQRLRRGLPLTLRYPMLVRNAVLTAVPLLLVAVTLALTASRRDSGVGASAALMVTTLPDGTTEIRSAPLDLEHWNPASNLKFGPAKRIAGPQNGMTGHATARPGTRSWATYSIFPDSGAGDIEIVDIRGTRMRLTSTPGDDRPMSFSPDGKKLLILTDRWNSNGWSDVAILNLDSGTVLRVTRGDATYYGPKWSPDGTRVSFTRQPERRIDSEICIAGSDGSRTYCRSIAGWHSVASAGWIGPAHLLVSGDSGDSVGRWIFYNVEDGSVSDAGFPPSSSVELDPASIWAVTTAVPAARNTTRVSPARRFDLAVTVPDDSLTHPHIQFLAPAMSPSFLDSVSIERPATPLPRNVPTQLGASGWSRDGKRMRARAGRWKSLTPGIATIDSLGVIVPAQTGTAVIEFSAGGWRTTVDSIPVEAGREKTIMRELWDAGAFERWRPFGEPPPLLVTSSHGKTFLNNGDGSFFSGVYLRETINGEHGIALDFDVTTPLNRTQWQYIDVEVAGPPAERERLDKWDHRTGYLGTLMGPRFNGCTYTYPGGEGAEAPTRTYWFESLRTVMHDPAFRLDDGRWYHVRVQFFPDGRCGLSVDGHPVVITRSESPASEYTSAKAMIAVIQGTSVGTQILVGPVTIRTGVPSDVPWTQLEFDGTRWINKPNRPF